MADHRLADEAADGHAVGTRAHDTGSGVDPAFGDDEGGEGEGGFDLPEEALPSGLAELVRRNLDDDAAYALQPDVALMRAEKLAAEFGVEVALVLKALGRRA